MNVVNQTKGEGVFGKSLSHDPSAHLGASAIIAGIKGHLVKGEQFAPNMNTGFAHGIY